MSVRGTCRASGLERGPPPEETGERQGSALPTGTLNGSVAQRRRMGAAVPTSERVHLAEKEGEGRTCSRLFLKDAVQPAEGSRTPRAPGRQALVQGTKAGTRERRRGWKPVPPAEGRVTHGSGPGLFVMLGRKKYSASVLH